LRGGEVAKERSPVYGAITRVVIEGVILRFHVENELVLQVTAERGVSNDRDELVLVDPLLARADGSRLVRTGRARWVPREHSFVLPGDFEIEHPGGVIRGTGAAVDMELEIL
jgi:hypothetical protein